MKYLQMQRANRLITAIAMTMNLIIAKIRLKLLIL